MASQSLSPNMGLIRKASCLTNTRHRIVVQEMIRQGEVIEIVGGTVMTDAAFRAFGATPRLNAIQIAGRLSVELPGDHPATWWWIAQSFL